MATVPANSINLTQDQLAKWLIEDLPYRIQIARIFPFMGIQGGKISYARTPVLETEANINSMATILGEGGTSGITTKTADPAASNSTFTLGELATRYKIEYSSMDRFKFPNNLDAVESALAIRRLIYMFYRKLDLATTGNPGDFPSLSDMCLATQRFASAAAPVAAAARIDELQKAYSLIKSNNGRPNAIMCNSRAYRWIMAAYYGVGANPEYVPFEWSDPIKGKVTIPLASINGTPIFINEMVATATNLTRIYFMVLGDACESGPVRGITGIVPGPLKDTLFIRRESTEPASATTTSLINVDYTFPVAIAMGSSGALSILDDVDVSAYTVPT